MRDAFGGTWLLYFFLMFIFIYVCFIAVIMNYASAYRTNNYIISELENMEGNVNWSSLKSEIKSKYNYVNQIGFCCSENSSGGVVYRVQTYVNFDVPLLNTNLEFAVETDSKTVRDGLCDSGNWCD